MIGITMGDACGIGPEIALKAWLNGDIKGVLIGDKAALSYCSKTLGLVVPINCVDKGLNIDPDVLNVYDCRLLAENDITIGRISGKCGEAAAHYVSLATGFALAGKIDAVVTLPINKKAVRQALPDFSGHTGFIAGLCNTVDYTMMLASDKLIVTHISTHVSLIDAIEAVQVERILRVIDLTHSALLKLRSEARIAVAGLNPHAGEGGAFGDEDDQIILPAVNAATKEGFNVEGPLPPDTVFYHALKGRYDAVVCMYHDQGHIPMKVLDFEKGVNVTLGLPFVRTSVDHGTAFDIAYQGKAHTESLKAALDMADLLIR